MDRIPSIFRGHCRSKLPDGSPCPEPITRYVSGAKRHTYYCDRHQPQQAIARIRMRPIAELGLSMPNGTHEPAEPVAPIGPMPVPLPAPTRGQSPLRPLIDALMDALDRAKALDHWLVRELAEGREYRKLLDLYTTPKR